MRRTVYVYNDQGTSDESVYGCIQAFTQTLSYPEDLVEVVKASELMECLKRQPPEMTALIMPGGADLPYLKLLDDSCIQGIRAVIAAGGSYIGICAGAYFASSMCIFEKDNPSLRVVGKRPLQLLEHPAIGAVRPNFCYASERGATEERLLCEWRGSRFDSVVYCNGGAAWDLKESGGTVTILARYTEAVLKQHGIENESPAAAVKRKYLNGVVVLMGVHPELPVHGGSDDDERRKKFLRCIVEAACL